MSSLRLPEFSPDRAILIAGPTASGKSSLALSLAVRHGRRIVNADALQVFDGWHLLTARPSADDLSQAVHSLYGHVSYRAEYSVGQWLRDLRPYLAERPAPIIVGGTGLYFLALTEGLADIPATSPEVRAEADSRLATRGIAALIDDLDPESRTRIDCQNPMRVQRAWEVQRQTGRGIATWQADTPPPALTPEHANRLVLRADRDWLIARIDRRFDQMIAAGAVDEAAAMEPDWDPARLSSKAIGAADLIAALRQEVSLADAVASAKVSSHQYAKRQRTWFRKRMRDWHDLDAAALSAEVQQSGAVTG